MHGHVSLMSGDTSNQPVHLLYTGMTQFALKVTETPEKPHANSKDSDEISLSGQAC